MLRFVFKIALVLSLIATPGVVFADEIISSDHDWSLRQTDAGAPFLFTAQNGGNFSVAPSKSNSSLLVMIIERQKLRNSARLVVGRYSMTLIPKPLPKGKTLLIGDVYPDNLRAFFDSLRESKALYVLSPEIKRTLSLQGADKEVIQFSMFSEKYLTQKAEQPH